MTWQRIDLLTDASVMPEFRYDHIKTILPLHKYKHIFIIIFYLTTLPTLYLSVKIKNKNSFK